MQIQYNLLNLPSQIFFENGNVIVNIYASNGMKLETRYITQITQDLSPINKTLNNITNIQAMSGKVYAGNIEYEYGNIRRQLALARVLNAEGYVTPLVGNSWGYFYYRKDYLGNNREVWQAPVFGTGAGEVVQITNYYPSGLPWDYNAGSGAAVQPYKYNGKEFVEENGLDEYDSQARMYYPAIARTTTPDPMAEKFYSVSPYAYCANNPIRYIDPDGRAYGDPPYTHSGFLTGYLLEKGGYFNVVKQGGYLMGNTINALHIKNNLNVVATNFQVNIGRALGVPNVEGGVQNAVRHTLWNALMSRDLGNEQATRAANSHETGWSLSTSQRSFSHNNTEKSIQKALLKADNVVDLLNNEIGRRIGMENPNADNKTLAGKVMEEYYTNGLYTTKQTNGTVEVVKTRITKVQYDAAMAEINKKGNDGLDK